ncbi:hypothetical protein DFH07DRAFT_750627, partial [Mycena maculata]
IAITVSYDIVCQWRINLWKRLSKYKHSLQEHLGQRYYVFLIPKFHLPTHIEFCNITYSFYLTPLVGCMDSEAPERSWANANPLAASTQEMGLGARQDVLDNHFNDWNHKKIVALGWLVESEASLPSKTVAEWRKSMEAWEADVSKPNRFNIAEKHASLEAIRL